MAIGIGANTAVFSVVDRPLLRSLPYPEGERLVMVYESGFGNPRNSVSPANWLDWLQESRSFDSLAAWNTSQATLTGDGDPEQLNGQLVSAEFFPLLRVNPAERVAFFRQAAEGLKGLLIGSCGVTP